jgi:hypothetical protein
VATHFSRLLRHAWVTVGLFLFLDHHTGNSDYSTYNRYTQQHIDTYRFCSTLNYSATWRWHCKFVSPQYPGASVKCNNKYIDVLLLKRTDVHQQRPVGYIAYESAEIFVAGQRQKWLYTVKFRFLSHNYSPRLGYTDGKCVSWHAHRKPSAYCFCSCLIPNTPRR